MKKITTIMLLAFALGCTYPMGNNTSFGAPPGSNQQVTGMTIVGEIDSMNQGYIIRGKTPAEIFTILNPDPVRLDPLIKNGRTVEIQVRVVSGDNVEILQIDGREYP